MPRSGTKINIKGMYRHCNLCGILNVELLEIGMKCLSPFRRSPSRQAVWQHILCRPDTTRNPLETPLVFQETNGPAHPEPDIDTATPIPEEPLTRLGVSEAINLITTEGRTPQVDANEVTEQFQVRDVPTLAFGGDTSFKELVRDKVETTHSWRA